jgi:aspergillopepsin I
VWLDSVELGGVTVPDVYIETAVHVSPSISIDPNLSGICGLCYDYPSDVYPIVEPFYRLLNATLKEPVFTADIYWQANGTYTFGAIDTSANETEFTWLPLVPNASFWEFVHNGINVGDSNVWLLSMWNGILDTGTSLILLDEAIVEYYYAAINGSKYDDSYGGWVFPCPEDLSTLPDLNIGFPGTSFVARIPGRFMLYEQMDPTYCYGGVQSSAGIGFDIFGDVFLKAMVVVFDYGNGRIGLAPKSP